MPSQPVTHKEFWEERDRLIRALKVIEIIVAVMAIGLLGMGIESVRLQIAHGGDIEAIQKQREDVVLEVCKAQNERHAKLKEFVEQLPSTRRAPPRQRQLLEQFVNALVPTEDCHAALLKKTRSHAKR
jgi:hypothetical protein